MTFAIIGIALVVVATVGFVVAGAIHDALVRRVERRVDAARVAMAAVLFDDDAAAAMPELLRVPTEALLWMVQNIAVDVGDAVYERLRSVVNDTELGDHIRELGRHRAWRRRVQAAHLAYLLPRADPDRLALLDDPHPLVRARAVESMPSEDIVRSPNRLLDMIDDPIPAVRAAAQQALLRGDSTIAEAVCGYLWAGPGIGTNLALEVAANLPDPRYGAVLRHYASDPDPQRRAMVARALGAGGTLDTSAVIIPLLHDDDERVRAAAARAVGGLQRVDLVGVLGHMLADPAWTVRRAAGTTLEEMGSAGNVVLRAHLFDDDRYARDMARQVLDAAAARRRTRPVAAPTPERRPA